MKKLLQMIVRWFEMTFNFNVKGLTPKDAQNSCGGGAEGGDLDLQSGLHLVGIIPALENTSESPALERFFDKGFEVESTVPCSGEYSLDNMFNKTGLKNASTLASFSVNQGLPEIIVTCDKPYIVNAYLLSGSSNDTYGPKAWTLYASSDKQNWVGLDTCTLSASMPAKSGEFRYLWSNTEAYKYFKLSITKSALSYGLHIKDFQLFQRLTF